jgi:hypothetical protein
MQPSKVRLQAFQLDVTLNSSEHSFKIHLSLGPPNKHTETVGSTEKRLFGMKQQNVSEGMPEIGRLPAADHYSVPVSAQDIAVCSNAYLKPSVKALLEKFLARR